MLKCRKVFEQEAEFVKLNAELDLQAQGLLQQFQNVLSCGEGDEIQSKNQEEEKNMSIYNIPNLGNDNESRKLNSAAAVAYIPEEKRKNSLSEPSAGEKSPQKLLRHKSELKIRDKYDGNIIPDSVKNLGVENVIRFLKSKVQILNDQLENLHKDERKLIEKVKELQADQEKVSEDRDRWVQQANVAKNLLLKHEQHATDVVVQLQNTQAENGFLKKEVEKLKKELKQSTQASGSVEIRLNRANEEIERLKTNLKQSKQEEKEIREIHKKKIDELSGNVKKVEKQKLELLNAFKKQQTLIDCLKKQKGLIEAGKLLKSVEDDFMEFLDWSPNRKV